MNRRIDFIASTRALAFAALTVFIGGCGGGSTGPQDPRPEPTVPSAARVEPALLALVRLGPADAVLTFQRQPLAADLAAVRATGALARPFRALPMVAVRATAAQIDALARLPPVRSIYANRRLAYFLNGSVPFVGAERVWSEQGVTGRGVTVAVLDSGIDATHADLPFGAKVVQNVKLAPDLFGTGTVALEGVPNTDTSSGHGTHVAGIVGGTGAALGGKYRGVAPGATLVGLGAGETLFVFSALEGFDWILRNRTRYAIRVVSNSWGTSGEFDADDPINVASKAAHDAGLVVVFAAGNSGPETDTLNPYCVAPWVICVAAGNRTEHTLADFSSRGVPGDPLYRPTLTAPGVRIASARSATGFVINAFFAVDLASLGTDAVYYARASGTSMATPHVSGTVALMLEANPALAPDQVRALLQQTATPMSGYRPHEVGAGYLNAYAAVRAALAQ
jgi:serine protease AprX